MVDDDVVMFNLREREVIALEGIGTALRDIAASMSLSYRLEREKFHKQYPIRGEVRDAEITHLQTEEEKIREGQGATDETDDEWVGSRQAKFEADQARKARRS